METSRRLLRERFVTGQCVVCGGDPTTHWHDPEEMDHAAELAGIAREHVGLVPGARCGLLPGSTDVRGLYPSYDLVVHYYLRDPNVGAEERRRFESDAGLANAAYVVDDSGPAEGGSVPAPRSIGLGTIVFD